MAAKKKKTRKARTPAVTNDRLEELFEHVASGGSVSEFCRQTGVSRSTLYVRLQDPKLAGQIARAKALAEEAIIDEMRTIADTGDESDVQHRKVRLWMREKQLVWNNPEKFGQKKQVTQTTTHKVELSEAEREIRIQQLLDKARTPQVEVEVHKDEELNHDRED